MNLPIEKFQQNFLRIKDHGTERSFYPALTNFLQDLAASERIKDIFATAEESAKAVAGGVGFPDITVRHKSRLVGWVEVKLPEDSLDSVKFNKQFEKYKDALENILFTNFKQWQLWQWGEEGKPVKVKEIIFNVANFTWGEEQNLIDILHNFFSGKSYEARTTKQLALALAKKTKLLSNQVEEAFLNAGENSDLVKLKETFEKTLIQNIEPHQFANMVAETVAYSLFLASLEHTKRCKSDTLTLTTAIDYLPTNVPILADLYSLIKKVAKVIPNIHQAITALVDQLNAAEMAKIELKLREHKRGEDPVIHFYEPFLGEYDPKEREARGVYYTPKPVVDYIVRSVDNILKERFGKQYGLTDESVRLLDPATGTGTFLMSAIQQIYSTVQKQNNTLGQEMVNKEFGRVVVNHILKHFYGFELLVAPYAVAHLKLTLLLEDLGFDFEMTKNDGDDDNDRLKVYLANTLDDPYAHQKQGKAAVDFGSIAFPSIAEESEAARKVKKDVPILAVMGNPPYSGISTNKGEWITKLIEDYKYVNGEHFSERKHWLQDDYVKFIRFAQWKIQENNHGVLAFITNHGFLDNPTFRGMRWQLMNAFDEIYILNLHGNLSKKEKCPDGSKDENVFNIQKGVSINIFIRKGENKAPAKLFYADLFGLKENKFEYLLTRSFTDTEWKELTPTNPYYFFVPKKEDSGGYDGYISLQEIFPINVTGIVTARDAFVIDFDLKALKKRIENFTNLSITDDRVTTQYNLKDTRGWKIAKQRRKLSKDINWPKYFSKITYRPFDIRSIYNTPDMIDWGREEIMGNMAKPNLGLCYMRQVSLEGVYSHFLVTNNIIDNRTFSSSKGIIQFSPLYIYPDTQRMNLFNEGSRKTNLSPEFIKTFSGKLGLKFDPDLHQKVLQENEESERDEKAGKGKKFVERWNQFARRKEEGKQIVSTRPSDSYFGPEDVFYYAYAIFHSPAYRSNYAEQLKIDFPRLPLTSDIRLFANMVSKGNEMVNLHLLGENPFDKSKTIFDDINKWRIQPKTVNKPDNIDDWKITEVKYSANDQRVYVNPGQYFEGVEKEVWEFMIGGYQVCEKWLKDRKKAERCLSVDDLRLYMKIVVALRETIRVMKEIDQLIPSWPLK